MLANLQVQARVPRTMLHFMAGLRFEGLWRYAVRRTPGGRHVWQRLLCEMREVPSPPTAADPEGAWWCARRCAAVLGQLPWETMCKVPTPSAAPAQLAQALGPVLPACRLQILSTCQVRALEGVLASGGGLLVRLHRQGARHWVWVVGIERRGRSGSLLVVAPRWLAPWGCGYGARLWVQGTGRWTLRGTDGQRLEGLGLEALGVLPCRPSLPSE